MKIVFNKPDSNSPGYLKRLKRVLYFQDAIKKKDYGVELVDQMVEFLADYITEPADRALAVEALWEASEEEFNLLLSAVTGEDDVPPANGEASQNTTM